MRASSLVLVLLAALSVAFASTQIRHRTMAAPASAEMCFFLSYSTYCIASPSDCLDLVNTAYTLTDYKVYHGDIIKAPENELPLGLGGVFVICAESNAPLNASFSYLNETLQAGVKFMIQRTGANLDFSFAIAYPNNLEFTMHFPIEETLHCYTKSSNSCFNYAVSLNMLQSVNSAGQLPVVSQHF